MLKNCRVSKLAMLVFFGSLVSCTNREVHRPQAATGWGNGGNTKISEELVFQTVNTMKDPIVKVYKALRALAKAEVLLAGSTDLHSDRELIELILLMTEPNEEGNKNVFDDLNTPELISLEKEGCLDYRGVSNAAGTLLLGVGEKICFSLPKLRVQSLTGGEDAFKVSVISLATHELVHHFVKKDSHDENEAIANKLQTFVQTQLIRSTVVANENIVSSGDYAFVDQSLTESEELLEQIELIPPASDLDQGSQK